MSQASPIPAGDDLRANLRWAAIAIVTICGVACGLYSLQFSRAQAVSVLGTAIVTGAAAGVIGAFVGFLFGIPKTLQRDEPSAMSGTSYLANTNLEQISDWLTKILVGIGLVQIADAPTALGTLADRLGPAFGGLDTSPAFALSLVLFCSIVGLALAYLWTRAYLPRILRASDRELTSQIKEALQVAADANAQALVLVNRALSQQSPPPQDELDAALAQATPDCLVTVYQHAEEQRLMNWRDDPAVMARSIPVFRALGGADTQHRYFRHFGSLGFALKDQPTPDYRAAASALDTAIAIRDRRGNRGLGIYEWNRALCLVKLDPAFAAGKKSAAKQRSAIEKDLKVAARQLTDDYFQGGPDDDGRDTLEQWMALNGVDLATLRA
jgi:hypothetical protein